MTDLKYITATKEEPIYIAYCEGYGGIEGPFKPCRIGDYVFHTFEVDFKRAVAELLSVIEEDSKICNNTKWVISKLDGSFDPKYDEPTQVQVFSMSTRQAKKAGLIK
jgi:hypothetical protein